ncbi:MAG: cold shock domain-containing protein [Deltaproteobacteria bacterium]|nr:cold shock domain-containing protein [Deltaproteobacteria bacterium]
MPDSWMPNTVSIPVVALKAEPLPETTAVADLFSKGEIIKFFAQQSYGFVRDQRGRELFFHIDEIDLLGQKNTRDYLQVGAKVGYDCCRTPHGLRVKRMKIY